MLSFYDSLGKIVLLQQFSTLKAGSFKLTNICHTVSKTRTAATVYSRCLVFIHIQAIQIIQPNHCYSNAPVVPSMLISHAFLNKWPIHEEDTVHLMVSTIQRQENKLGEKKIKGKTTHPHHTRRSLYRFSFPLLTCFSPTNRHKSITPIYNCFIP